MTGYSSKLSRRCATSNARRLSERASSLSSTHCSWIDLPSSNQSRYHLHAMSAVSCTNDSASFQPRLSCPMRICPQVLHRCLLVARAEHRYRPGTLRHPRLRSRHRTARAGTSRPQAHPTDQHIISLSRRRLPIRRLWHTHHPQVRDTAEHFPLRTHSR